MIDALEQAEAAVAACFDTAAWAVSEHDLVAALDATHRLEQRLAAVKLSLAGPSRSPQDPNHKQHEYDHSDRDAVGVLPAGERCPRRPGRTGHLIPVRLRRARPGNGVRGRQRPIRQTLVQLCLLAARRIDG
ncbi:hypothetical protein ACFYPW_16355 [Micromonospora zamorensis]|uniref:hypothetical protein n=1 Tax=Micromonospora zamorensis TaxID=709883 RepID=UPI00367EF468